MTFESIVTGETETLGPFTLSADGAAFSLTGYTVTTAFTKGDGTDVTTAGTVTVLTQSGATVGQITYAPHTDDFARSTSMSGFPRKAEEFGIRWKVTNTSTSKFKYFPSGPADILPVYGKG
jgi:hypothetical protein